MHKDLFNDQHYVGPFVHAFLDAERCAVASKWIENKEVNRKT